MSERHKGNSDDAADEDYDDVEDYDDSSDHDHDAVDINDGEDEDDDCCAEADNRKQYV